MQKQFISLLTLAVLIFPSLTIAEPTYRGFQIGITDFTDEEINSLNTDWHANVVRIQVGNNAEMDGTTGAAYFQMISDNLDEIDLLIPKFTANSIKVILTLYSPPGGFLARFAPSHYAMFSDLSLQDEFVTMWGILATRYKDNPTVIGYDLSNEPALRKSLKSKTSLPWPDLIKRTIAEIRTIDPIKQIIVKSLYGNPATLAALPKLNDPNFCYSFHVYPDNRYINQGFDGKPIKHNPPKKSVIIKHSFLPIQKLLRKFPLRERSNVCFNIGEFAVPRWAPKADNYMQNLLRIFEASRVPATTYARARKINLQSWTYHAFNESTVWDPRASTDPNIEEFPIETPLRAVVLQTFMQKNQ